jgi:hypothetical protein
VNNGRRFGEEGAVDPMVSYSRPALIYEDVAASTANALKTLSEDSENGNKLRYMVIIS